MSDATSTYASLRARALALDTERAALERQLAALLSELGEHSTGALITSDGFPRADIDVGAVAAARGAIARLRNDVNAKAKEVEAFAARLKVDLGLPVHLVDETLTSHEAESTISKHRRREVRASGIVDSRAATLILQDFLNQKFPQAEPDEGR